jgi:hypothetical protein
LTVLKNVKVLPSEFRKIGKTGSLSHWKQTISTRKSVLSKQYSGSYSEPKDSARMTTNRLASS